MSPALGLGNAAAIVVCDNRPWRSAVSKEKAGRFRQKPERCTSADLVRQGALAKRLIIQGDGFDDFA